MPSEPLRSPKMPKALRGTSSRSPSAARKRLHDPTQPGVPSKTHPEVDVSQVVRSIVRRGLLPTASKALISLRIDRDVLEWFRAQGPGYQTRMNQVLKAFRDASA